MLLILLEVVFCWLNMQNFIYLYPCFDEDVRKASYHLLNEN